MINAYPALEQNKEQRFIPLLNDSKVPNTKLVLRGHYDARSYRDFPPAWYESRNYGLVLDAQYIVVDFDTEHPDRVAFEKRLPVTWTQQTRKGVHYLYKVPIGFQGKNIKLKATDGTILGDLKALGYIVCPGSTVLNHEYTLTSAVEPVLAPEWLLRHLDTEKRTRDDSSPSFDVLPDGARDNSLHKIASNLRGIGFAQVAIENALRLLVQQGFVEQPEGREIEESDIKRLAKSASKYETETNFDSLSLIPENAINGADIELVGPPTKWHLRGFIPQGELVTMFGKGGIGKSTFASWLCADITRKGGTFAVCSVEEPFSRFVARAVLCGADRTRIYAIPKASQVVFPRDAHLLRDFVSTLGVDILFFDSVYSHFEYSAGMNMAEKSRSALSALAEIAQTEMTTILCNFHENKMGAYLGSVEMENVARVMLKFTRRKNKPLRAHVEKTNKRAPEYDLLFPGIEVAICDPQTGEVQLEADDNGVLAPEMIVIAQNPVRTAISEESDSVDENEYISINDLGADKDEDYKRIRDYCEANPELTQRKWSEDLGVSRSKIRRALGLMIDTE